MFRKVIIFEFRHITKANKKDCDEYGITKLPTMLRDDYMYIGLHDIVDELESMCEGAATQATSRRSQTAPVPKMPSHHDYVMNGLRDYTKTDAPDDSLSEEKEDIGETFQKKLAEIERLRSMKTPPKSSDIGDGGRAILQGNGGGRRHNAPQNVPRNAPRNTPQNQQDTRANVEDNIDIDEGPNNDAVIAYNKFVDSSQIEDEIDPSYDELLSKQGGGSWNI